MRGLKRRPKLSVPSKAAGGGVINYYPAAHEFAYFLHNADVFLVQASRSSVTHTRACLPCGIAWKSAGGVEYLPPVKPQQFAMGCAPLFNEICTPCGYFESP